MKTHYLLFALPSVFAIACASTPPQELKDAHSAFDRASHGPAATIVPADVHTAQEQLALADQSFNENGDSPETRDLAYAAQRHAQLAEVRAQVLTAQKQQVDGKAQLDQSKDRQVQVTSAKLTNAQQQLASQGQQLAMVQQ